MFTAKLYLVMVTLGLVVLLAGACNSQPSPAPYLEGEADFIGWVTEVQPIGKKGTLGQISVESHVEKLVDKYVVTITDETLISQQGGEERRAVGFEALKAKQQVQIWFSGPIMESFPMQGTAQQIVITKSPQTPDTEAKPPEPPISPGET